MGFAATNMGVGARLPVTKRESSALDRLVDFVSKRGKTFKGDFNEFERELGERLRQVGQEVLRDEIGKADVDVEAVRIDGLEHRRVLRGTETYMTTMGPVTVERTLYKDHTDPAERAVAALEGRLGIIQKFWTPEAAKQATWVVSQMSPGLAEELFRRTGTMHPSKSSLDRLPKDISAHWEENRVEFEAELRAVTVIPADTASVAISLDGVLVPMADGGAVATRQRAAEEGRPSKGPAGYREVGCATISFCDEDGEMISAIRFARMPESKKLTLKSSLLAELRSVFEQRPDLPIVKIADGTDDNWEFLSRQVPIGLEVLDFYHAAENLGHAVAAAYGDGTRETRLRFDELRSILLEDIAGVESVIRTLDYLRRKHPRRTRIAQALGYFRRNRKRMRYAELRAKDLPIGSGPVEAACKTLAAQRMKQSGMRWGIAGGQAILTTRGWTQSERFDKAWALVASTYNMQVTTLDNVISLKRL
jgi:hypothetical protein